MVHLFSCSPFFVDCVSTTGPRVSLQVGADPRLASGSASTTSAVSVSRAEDGVCRVPIFLNMRVQNVESGVDHPLDPITILPRTPVSFVVDEGTPSEV